MRHRLAGLVERHQLWHGEWVQIAVSIDHHTDLERHLVQQILAEVQRPIKYSSGDYFCSKCKAAANMARIPVRSDSRVSG